MNDYYCTVLIIGKANTRLTRIIFCHCSWFYDAPCSNLGLSQADELAKFLKKAPSKSQADFVSILRADPGAPPSRILCSNLRRALSTVAAGFRDRFRRHPEDKILIVPSLQEIRQDALTCAYDLFVTRYIANILLFAVAIRTLSPSHQHTHR
jgi:hypothetical protein